MTKDEEFEKTVDVSILPLSANDIMSNKIEFKIKLLKYSEEEVPPIVIPF
jgi:hypothetical protein